MNDSAQITLEEEMVKTGIERAAAQIAKAAQARRLADSHTMGAIRNDWAMKMVDKLNEFMSGCYAPNSSNYNTAWVLSRLTTQVLPSPLLYVR
ncbi:MAG: hypothetical protein HC888_01090 [Candidatus Competibacteraceae bacterium]|nr:hypothetical protein [Candidatus Competibacteraceae bacterium]